MSDILSGIIKFAGKNFPQTFQKIKNSALNIPAINRLVIDRLASSTAARPHPFSLFAPYTSWQSLTDRSFTGRHLPVADKSYSDFVNNIPLPQVGELFRRKELIPCTRSSAMFMNFAQWFTDGFLRTDPVDNRKNTSNHEIDLCQIYGLHPVITDQLRAKTGGRMKSQIIGGEEYPPYAFENGVQKPEFSKLIVWGPKTTSIPLGLTPEEAEKRQANLFAMGTERANSTLGYATLNTLFIREHNRVAGILEKAYPTWDDERIFQTTRNILIVILIKIVVEDYIAHISTINLKADPSVSYNKKWYRNNWMTIEFDLLYRWHALTPDKFNVPSGEVPFNDYMYNNALLTESGIGKMMSAFSAQHAGQIGLYNTPNFLFPIEAANVAYTRKFQLRSYNEYRVCFGLPAAKDFSDITKNPALQAELKKLYGSVDKVEWYVGMYAEDRSYGAMMGDLQTAMVANDAFSQALTNPLLAENVFNPDTFSPVGWEIILETNKLDQLLARNSKSGLHCSFRKN